ncbi:MAG: LPS-assembly protein LptD [Treponema sp.]|jgi:hypothetical protein|nr:LPS-assembly protein LptD [Treponema sp.]
MRKAGLFLLLCLPLAVFSQEAEQGPAEQRPAEAAESGEPDKPRGLTPEFILDRDLATASLPELADWCRSLGLNGEGTREELVSRLRDYYKPAASEAEAAAGRESGETAPGETPADMAEGPPEGEVSEEPDPPAQKRELVITIESAQATEYFTVESVHEEYARLRGGVSVSLQDGEILHRVQAEEILYNRTRKIMTASGGVVYVKEDGDKVETFRGEGITVNLDNWSTAFMKGISDHEISDGVSTYRFEGEVISRSGENSTVLRRAKITNPKEPEAFWSIDASKLWLLPGSDWAVLNAVVKVGEIPVLWFPAFYYPANEIIFHPVLGIRTREGSFVQTTTYLLGRPKALPLAEESSITTIMGSGEGMEKVREGVFLRSTGRRARDESEVKLSLLGDAYVNLGYYLGTELTVPGRGYFGDLNFSGGMAWSRDIAYDYGNYTPFYPKYDGTSTWHSSYFFDSKVPFRYRFVSTGSVGGSGTAANSANLSWNLPLYSDPYVDNDFMRRSEDSSFFSLLQNSTKPDMTVNSDSISSYIWSLDGNLSFVTAGLSPYINELTLTSVNMAVSFETRNTTPPPDSMLSYPPGLSFFYPSKFTLFSVSASIGGMPLVLGERTDPGRGEDAYIEGWGKAVSPWTDPENPGGEEDPLGLHPPALTRTINAPLLGGQRFALDYRLTPSAASEIKFNSNGVDPSAPPASRDVSWKNPEDIDWGDMAYQLYTIRADATVGLTLSEKRDIYTNTLRFYGVSSWQDYSYMNERAAEFDDATEREAAMRQVHNMTYFSSSAEYGFTLRPFYQSDVWNTTNFRYSVKGLLVKSEYDSVNDSWEVIRGKWNREDIEFHQVQANFNANVMDKMQNLSLTTDIPPEENALAADATARVWISESNARTRVQKPFDDPYYEPVYMTETLRFTEKISLRHYMVYDPELPDFTILTTSFLWGGLTASFTATRSRGYELIDNPENDPLKPPTGWYLKDEEEKLNPQELSIGYGGTQSFNDGRRLSFEGTVNTGLSFDLQRYTYSKFFFSLGVTAKINRFVDITVSSYSENAVVYRYFQDLPFYSHIDLEMPGEKNILLDLINSFRFDDIERRKSSGFKLKSFNLDVVHHLGDWDATLGIKLAPEFDTAALQYKFNTQISFTVQWKPVKEFKSTLDYNSDEGLIYE